MKQNVIHLEIKKSDVNEHRYYGSKAAVYDDMEPAGIGITYDSLRRHGNLVGKPYENKKCIIRQGSLVTKKGNRGGHLK